MGTPLSPSINPERWRLSQDTRRQQPPKGDTQPTCGFCSLASLSSLLPGPGPAGLCPVEGIFWEADQLSDSRARCSHQSFTTSWAVTLGLSFSICTMGMMIATI